MEPPVCIRLSGLCVSSDTNRTIFASESAPPLLQSLSSAAILFPSQTWSYVALEREA